MKERRSWLEVPAEPCVRESNSQLLALRGKSLKLNTCILIKVNTDYVGCSSAPACLLMVEEGQDSESSHTHMLMREKTRRAVWCNGQVQPIYNTRLHSTLMITKHTQHVSCFSGLAFLKVQKSLLTEICRCHPVSVLIRGPPTPTTPTATPTCPQLPPLPAPNGHPCGMVTGSYTFYRPANHPPQRVVSNPLSTPVSYRGEGISVVVGG